MSMATRILPAIHAAPKEDWCLNENMNMFDFDPQEASPYHDLFRGGESEGIGKVLEGRGVKGSDNRLGNGGPEDVKCKACGLNDFKKLLTQDMRWRL